MSPLSRLAARLLFGLSLVVCGLTAASHAAAPVLTAVNPNPIPPGTVNLTVTGTGFSTSSNIWVNGVQYGAQYTAPSTLTTQIYLASNAGSAAVSVNNLGVFSNTITVPLVGSTPPASYTLTVNGGSGSGTYAAGATVSITANAPPANQQFQSWTGAGVANPASATTTLTMPAANTTVSANFGAGQASPPPASGLSLTSASPNPIPPGSVTITVSGTGFVTSSYIWVAGVQYGTHYIDANTLQASIYLAAGQSTVPVLVKSQGQTSNTLNIPMVGAPSGTPSSYTLTVNNGTGSGTYAAGATVTISANAAPANQQFQSWTGASVANAAASTTTLVMPSANATVTATYAAAGQNNNPPPAGQTITSVSPNPLTTGTVNVTVIGTGFSAGSAIWVGGTQYSSQLGNGTLSTQIYIPAGTTSASFSVHGAGGTSNTVIVPVAGPPVYPLTVTGGSGSGSYPAGTVVTISAGAAPSGQVFSGWTGANVANSSASTTTVTMPNSSVAVTANYANGPAYPLTVVGGNGSGNYVAGEVVNIAANPPPAGQSFLGWTGSVANANAANTTVTMPAAAVTVTANFTQPTYTLTVINGSGSGNYAAGKSVAIVANPPPPGQYFQHWTGTGIANTALSSTIEVMPQANTTVTAFDYSPPPIPFPVSGHPRLWLTAADLPRLQSWATASNPVYQESLPVLNVAISSYYSCFPGQALGAKNPTPAANYPDLGDTQGYQGVLTEECAMILAFHSLIDPNPANRIQYAQAARNLIMYALNQAALGFSVGVPFRDPQFCTFNRASFTGYEWPLVVDWIYNQTDANNNPILTAADKAVVQQVFLMWCVEDYGINTTGNNPGSQGVVNSPALFPSGKPNRWASNNYYVAHARNLTMMALSIDPADDVQGNLSVPPSIVGNSLRSFIVDGTGAWLYQLYGMMGDQSAVAQAYQLPGNPTAAGFGLASGGLPPEGFLYGESYGYILGQLLALQTAGFNDPSLSGPQIALIGAPVWDRYVQGFISSLTPAAQVNPTATYYGPIYQFAGYGDMLRDYVTPDFMRPFSLLALLEQENGQTTHLNAARWFTRNAPTGGASTLASRISDPWTWGVGDTLLAYMLFDPSAPLPTDPRPSYPTEFYDAPAGRIVAHSDWSAMGSMFSYKASWESINHQDATGGQFELYRKGEWLTSEMSNYDNNAQGLTSVYHNTLALQNWCSAGIPNLNWNEPTEWANGSQWMWGFAASDPTTVTSSGTGYIYAASDLTGMYNRPSNIPADAANDVTQATRSIVWMNHLGGSDYIVVYDRAASTHPGLFKRWNLCLVNPPATQVDPFGTTIATETMADGQQLFVQTLLPQNASVTFFNGASQMNPVAELEPMQYVYTVQDGSVPTTTRFLHVLQGADAGVIMASATYVQSTSGTAFDGAVFAANVVYFPTNSGAVAATTLPAPAGVHSALVTGLAANTAYGVLISPDGNGGNVIAITPGGSSATADSAGVLQLSF